MKIYRTVLLLFVLLVLTNGNYLLAGLDYIWNINDS